MYSWLLSQRVIILFHAGHAHRPLPSVATFIMAHPGDGFFLELFPGIGIRVCIISIDVFPFLETSSNRISRVRTRCLHRVCAMIHSVPDHRTARVQAPRIACIIGAVNSAMMIGVSG